MIIATDLDRTLLPNGHDDYDQGSIERLNGVIDQNGHVFVYASGRNLQMLNDAIEEFGIAVPDYFIAEVGTTMYAKEDGQLTYDMAWDEEIHRNNPSWDVELIKQQLTKYNIRLQEDWKNNKYKLSYYLDLDDNWEETLREVKAHLGSSGLNHEFIYSVDPLENAGLIDILPNKVSKLSALEFLRTQLGHSKDELVFCGDSGNDILPLTFGYKSILVNNASAEIKEEVRGIAQDKGLSDKLYIASGAGALNGNYAAGILEGLEHFSVS